MSSTFCKFTNFHAKTCFTALNLVRQGHHLRGKPPGIARTINQRLNELNYKDPSIAFRVDIGLPPPIVSRSKQMRERLAVIKAQRKDANLEKLSRNIELKVDLDKVGEDWVNTTAFNHIKTVADHYGVFEHLFGDAYFLPVVDLKVHYGSEEISHPVYWGNVLKPQDTKFKPNIDFSSNGDSLWTLVLTNPDGHFTEQDKEYVHWFVGNIPGNAVDKGETIIDYLQPFPPKGTGYHRHVFVLYKQDRKLDFSSLKRPGPCLNLEDRTFSTADFYRERQDDITPGGLAFFQADWDSTLTDFYHNTLDMKEPVFEYDFPPPYIKKEATFPRKKEPFNLYMDKYRDPKQINKEFLVKKLANVHPFKAPKPPLPFPNAVAFDQSVPSWLKVEIRKSRNKWGRINDIE